ncbi:MAG: trimeric intracellular cation channel family protein [Cytophagales bacterium]|nr:trimeric intracellular cation channel family protein [Cytophagales bacterium]
MLYIIDLIGVTVFAISGGLTARDKQLDVFGIAAVAFITALGGGTLRDVLMGSTPVGWMVDLRYLIMIAAGISVSLMFGERVRKFRRTFFLFDSIGIAVFTVLGLQKALALGMHPVIAVMMGMISAVFGRVTRDVICNEIPLIFRKEIYALACLFGGTIFILLRYLDIDSTINILVTIIIIFALRSLAVRFKWNLSVFS